MNRLKSKASQFFKDSPTQDEKIAITPTDREADFSAGIERSLRKKPSRFLRKQNEKPLPRPPCTALSDVAPPPLPKDRGLNGCADATVSPLTAKASAETGKPLPPRPVSQEPEAPKHQAVPDEESSSVVGKAKQADLVLKKRPSFASLRKSGSRIFRSNTGDHGPPPPPMPQIPIDTPTPKPHRPTIRPFDSVRSARSSLSSQARITSISRPILSTRVAASPNPYTVPITKPTGPPPPRPARAESVDEDLVALARDGGARTMLHSLHAARPLTTSTATTTTTTSSTWSSELSQTSSEEACARLGLPSGHTSPYRPSSTTPTPRAATLPIHLNGPHSAALTPWAARFPDDAIPPLDSSVSVKDYGLISAYIKARQRYVSASYDDGVEACDREMGPVEIYDASKCADWTLERRVSGKLGERGMLFRDRWGGWHLVVDI